MTRCPHGVPLDLDCKDCFEEGVEEREPYMTHAMLVTEQAIDDLAMFEPDDDF